MMRNNKSLRNEDVMQRKRQNSNNTTETDRDGAETQHANQLEVVVNSFFVVCFLLHSKYPKHETRNAEA